MNAQNQISKFFLRNGCIRIPNRSRLKEGYKKYKKGSEVRFTAMNRSEEAVIKTLFNKLGIKFGKSFQKVKRIIIPVYGHDSVTELKKIIRNYKKRSL